MPYRNRCGVCSAAFSVTEELADHIRTEHPGSGPVVSTVEFVNMGEAQKLRWADPTDAHSARRA